MTLGCRRCCPGEHLPPPRRVCPELCYPSEPEETPVECQTPRMRRAWWARALEWALVAVLATVLAATLLTGSLVAPPGPQEWFWLSLLVLLAWGAAASTLAARTVARTDRVGIMMAPPHMVAIALVAWIVGVFERDRLVSAGVAAMAMMVEMYRAYGVGREKPSATTYALFLGFRAYFAGLSFFVFAVELNACVGIWVALAMLGLAVCVAFDHYSVIFAAPVFVGVVAWELGRATALELPVFAAVFAALLVRNAWYRLLSADPAHGRNLFVRPTVKEH